MPSSDILKDRPRGSIYIHIPFCRQACRYCDFFFSVSLKYQDTFVERLLIEIRQRSRQNKNTKIASIYLGGGTPSLLSPGNLQKIMDSIRTHYQINKNAEITMECNPDDLGPASLEHMRKTGINRISIGIQSFKDEELELMRRSHKAEEAYTSVKNASAAGFENITVDLIYGLPRQSVNGWKENLDRTLTLPVVHISAYHLSFEPGTVFDHWRKKGRLKPPEEELSVEMYRTARERLLAHGFEHYEISSFAKPGRKSIHNQGYWSGDSYLGFGPSAHSYNGINRSWNISSLKGYMEGMARGESIKDSEKLTRRDRYHDYLITSLRTSNGADPEKIEAHFGQDIRNHFDRIAEPYIANRTMTVTSGRVTIDPRHWLVSDHILRDLFLADDGSVTDSQFMDGII